MLEDNKLRKDGDIQLFNTWIMGNSSNEKKRNLFCLQLAITHR